MEHSSAANNLFHSDIKILFESVFTTRHQNPTATSSPPFFINFELSCNAHLSKWIINENIPTLAHFVEEVNSPLMVASVPNISLPEFLCYEKARETIAQEIKDFPLWDMESEGVIDSVLTKAREAIISMPPNHNVLHLRVHVAVLHELFFAHMRDLFDWMTQYSMEVDEVPMVPAKDSLLERKC